MVFRFSSLNTQGLRSKRAKVRLQFSEIRGRYLLIIKNILIPMIVKIFCHGSLLYPLHTLLVAQVSSFDW